MKMKRAMLTAAAAAAACDDAQIASSNLSRAADNFEIMRRVVFLNGITDTYLLSIEGLCSVEDQQNQLEVTCKTADREYQKALPRPQRQRDVLRRAARRSARERVPLPGGLQAADDHPRRRLPRERAGAAQKLLGERKPLKRPGDRTPTAAGRQAGVVASGLRSGNRPSGSPPPAAQADLQMTKARNDAER